MGAISVRKIYLLVCGPYTYTSPAVVCLNLLGKVQHVSTCFNVFRRVSTCFNITRTIKSIKELSNCYGTAMSCISKCVSKTSTHTHTPTHTVTRGTVLRKQESDGFHFDFLLWASAAFQLQSFVECKAGFLKAVLAQVCKT